MTPSLIHLKIVEKDNFDFDQSLFLWAKAKASTLVCFDFDNHSGNEMYGYAQQLIAQSSDVVLLVTIEASSNVAPALAWIESMMKKHAKLYLIGKEIQPRYLSILAKKFPAKCAVVDDIAAAKILIVEQLKFEK